MQIVTGRRGEPHVTSRQMQAVYRSFLGDFALLDIGEKLRAEAYSDDIVRVYDGVVSVQGIYAVIAYNQYDEVYIEPVSVGKKRIDTIVLHYTKDNTLDVEDLQLDVVQGEEYTDNPIAPVVPEGGDAWEGTTDIQVAIYDVEVTNFGLTVTPYARMLNLIPTLESIAERIPETVVTGVKGDSEVLYRDGDVNITKANIGLGNVDNTADADKPISTATQTALNLKADLTYVDAKISAAYHAGGNLTVAELTSALLIADNMGKVYNMSDSGVTTSDFVEGAGESINEGDNVGICNVGTEESPVYKFDLLSGFVDLSAYYTKTESDNKYVAKETGKGLSTNDYTTADKTKLAGISEGATQTIANPADTATETLSKVEIEGTVYDIPQGASGATELSELTDVNLSNVEDNDILQYDETANKWKNSNALQGAKTATGNPLTITDAAPVNAVNLSMDLEPIQDLHGYDHPWVGGAGKNKLPVTVDILKANNISGTWSGNVYTIGNRTFEILVDSDNNVVGIKVNGSNANRSAFNLIMGEMSGYSGMILNGCPANGSSSSYAIISGLNKSPWTGYGIDYGSGIQLINNIPSSNASVMQIEIYANYNAQNLIFYPMIRLSTETDSSFAPYENICPISGRSEVTIDRVGKNLWDEEWENGTYNDSTHTFVSGSGLVSKNYIKISPDKSYYFKFRNATTGGNCYIVYYDDNKNFISDFYTSTDKIIDKPSNAKYIRFYIWGSSSITEYAGGICLNISDASFNGQYEPYAGKTYTIQLGDTVYGGTLDVTRGELRVTHGYADLGNYNWTYSTSENIPLFYFSRITIGAKSNSIVKCSNYKYLPNFWQSSANDYCIAVGSNAINISDSRFNNASDFKTAMSGVQMTFELATPFTIQLNPQQIKLLENTNTIYTDYNGDIITIEYQPNNSIGEAVRVVEESYDPEFAVRPVLKKKSFSGTTDSDGSVTLINASDIPSNHRIIPLQITDMTIGGSAGTYFVEYKPYNSGDSVKGYCYTYFNGSQITPVGTVVTGNFYYYDLEV